MVASMSTANPASCAKRSSLSRPAPPDDAVRLGQVHRADVRRQDLHDRRVLVGCCLRINTHAPDIGLAVERRSPADAWLERGNEGADGPEFVEFAAAGASDGHRVTSDCGGAGVERSAESKCECWCEVAAVGAVGEDDLGDRAGQNEIVGRDDESCKAVRPARDLDVAQFDERDGASSIGQVDFVDAGADEDHVAITFRDGVVGASRQNALSNRHHCDHRWSAYGAARRRW